MESQQEILNYLTFTLVTYKTNDDKIWVTTTDMANAAKVKRKVVENWTNNIHRGTDRLIVKIGQYKKETFAYPIDVLVDLLNYLQDTGHIKARRFTLSGLMESLQEIKALDEKCHTEVETKTVYLISAADTNVYKIGYTGRDIKERLKTLQTSSANQLTCLYHRKVPSGRWLERMLHNHYASKRMVGEWFNLTDAEVKECIDLIKSA